MIHNNSLDSYSRLSIKRATAVSEKTLYNATNVFDGNNITYYESSENNTIGPVIEIELTGVRAVNTIRILTKLDCYGEQISRLEIRVGNHEVSVGNVDAMKANDLCNTYQKGKREATNTESGDSRKEVNTEDTENDETVKESDKEMSKKNDRKTGEVWIMCNETLFGKYVTIHFTDERVQKICLAEVEIYGEIIGRCNKIISTPIKM